MFLRNNKFPLPGFRNIKTAIAIFICLVLYKFFGREGSYIIAITSALICMEDSIERSLTIGINRLLGTSIGGVFGLFIIIATRYITNLLNINLDIQNGIGFYIWALICCIGLVIFIFILNLIKKNSSIVIGSFVYLVIVLDFGLEDPVLYSFNRVLDTAIGITVAVFVNHFFFRPEHDRQEIKLTEEKDSKFKYKLIRNINQNPYSWKGGIVTELLISPPMSNYAERNFNWRLSVSTTDQRETKFTVLPGFKRYLMVLSGKTKLLQGENTVNLNQYDKFNFNGDVETICFGLSTDFNLIFSEKYCGKVDKYLSGNKYNIKNFEQNNLNLTQILYSMYDNTTLSVNISESENFDLVLNKGDIFMFENIEKLDQNDIAELTVKNNDKIDQDVIVICSSLTKK